MAEPVDKVQLGKQESTTGGGNSADDDPFTVYAPLDPNEDAPEVQGVFFQPPSPSTTSDKNVYITRDGSGNMIFRDPNTDSGNEVSLTDLFATGGGGEANTAANVGGGIEIFRDKTGVTINLRTLVAGSDIDLTQNADTIEITAGRAWRRHFLLMGG